MFFQARISGIDRTFNQRNKKNAQLRRKALCLCAFACARREDRVADSGTNCAEMTLKSDKYRGNRETSRVIPEMGPDLCQMHKSRDLLQENYCFFEKSMRRKGREITLAFQPVYIFHRAQTKFERHRIFLSKIMLDAAKKRQALGRPAWKKRQGGSRIGNLAIVAVKNNRSCLSCRRRFHFWCKKEKTLSSVRTDSLPELAQVFPFGKGL